LAALRDLVGPARESVDSVIDAVTGYDTSVFKRVREAVESAYPVAELLEPISGVSAKTALFGPNAGPTLADPELNTFLQKALSSEVLRRAFAPEGGVDSGQKLRFAQLTPSAPCPLLSANPLSDEGPSTAEEKLTGIKLGHFVTNPGIRDPTITASWYATMQDVSNGRMVMGIGRGDSSRRVVGLKPVRVAEFEASCRMIKDLMNGRPVEWNGKELQLEWAKDLPEIPMWIAGYGPRALAVAGRVADGVIIQLADPQIIQWIMDTARKAAEEAGRDPSELKCIVGAPSHITDDLAEAREQVRWFPAMVSNHVMDLIERYGFDSEIPAALTDFVKARKFYDYKDHSRVGAAHGEFVTDEIADRFTVIGNVEQVTAKLKELESVGVDQFNIYLMTEGQNETLATYGKEILPAFHQVAA
jgi:probable F420-dependent oxidoreductase